MATLAVLCGAGRGTEVELFGHQKQAWPTTFLALPHGIPLHDTFGRGFLPLDPAPLEVCLVRWVRSLSEVLQAQVVSVDGKAARRSRDVVRGPTVLRCRAEP